MPTVPGPVDSAGNITVPAEGGAIIPIRSQTNEEPPAPIDITGTPMRFYVKGRLDLVPVIDPDYAMGMRILITEEEADQLSTAGHPFQLLDLSNPSIPSVMWQGTIRRGK